MWLFVKMRSKSKFMSTDPIQLPDVAVLHVDSIAESAFDEIRRAVEGEGLKFHAECREPGPQAGIEWLLPTALVVFFFKSYFDGIFKEIGKDHYSLVKAALKPHWSRFLGPAAPKKVAVGTVGKVRADQPYSLVYSIVADATPRLKFKLLFPSDLSEKEYEEAVAVFFEFLRAFHGQTLAAPMVAKLQSARVIGNTVLLVYDQDDSGLRVVDPMPKSRGDQ